MIRSTRTPSLVKKNLLRSFATLPIRVLPGTLGSPLTGPMVWQDTELDAADYVIQLSPSDVDDIKASVLHFK